MIHISLAKEQVIQMLTIQHESELALHPDWTKQAWPFHMAIIVEVGELIEHTTWKWWKDTSKVITPEAMQQIHLELVDIWHFGMSIKLIQFNLDIEGIADRIIHDLKDIISYEPPVKARVEDIGISNYLIETTVNLVSRAAVFDFDVLEFLIVCAGCGLDPLRLYNLYLAKNILNQFRQANGYKEGTYQKIWQGREDNAWLMDIINENEKVTADMLWSKLYDMYAYRNNVNMP